MVKYFLKQFINLSKKEEVIQGVTPNVIRVELLS